MIVATVVWLAAGLVIIGILAVAWTQEPSPPPTAAPPTVHPRAAMRLVFVSLQGEHLVIDGLLDLGSSSFGIPTAWSFTCPSHPVLLAATLDVLARWADDGLPVALDLSHLTSVHPSVAFRRDEVLVRLSALPRHDSHEQAR